MINLLSTIGSFLMYPICYVFQMLGYPISEEAKNATWSKVFAGVATILAMIYVIYLVPMLMKKKKRRYTKKASRRKRRK